MSDPLSSEIPPAWQVYVPIATALARGLLNVAGGIGFTWALTVNASELQMGVSAAMIVFSLLWSAWQKVQSARAINVAASNPKNAPAPKLPA